MSLRDLLIENRSAILKAWLSSALEVYPRASRDFIGKGGAFSDPIGSTLRDGMNNLFEEILEPAGEGRSRPVLERVLRVRAIENLSPSQAVGFLPLLRGVIREVLEARLENVPFPEWSAINDEIDRLILQAFDIYMECREKIHELKNKDGKKRTEN